MAITEAVTVPKKYNDLQRLGRGVSLNFLLFVSVTATAMAQSSGGPPPLFGSLKTDRVDARASPEKPVSIVFRRAGLPVEILDSVKEWQRVRDAEGTTGWVIADFVSKRRTALVLAPTDRPQEQLAVRSAEASDSTPIAYLEPGVIVNLIECARAVCRVNTSDLRGFVDRRRLWGASDGVFQP